MNDPRDKEENYDRRKMKREEMNIQEYPIGHFLSYITENQSEGTTYDMVIESANKAVKYSIPDDRALIEDYWKALALAHECTIDEVTGQYTGLSSDDIELVKACKEQGFDFIKSDVSNFRRLKIGLQVLNYEVMKVNEFTSDRKRMSIIIIDGDQIKLYIKGADSEIEKRLSLSSNEAFLSQARLYIKEFSNMGYRTLMVGMRILDKEELRCYLNGVREAGLKQPKEKEKELERLNNQLENNVYLLGATIVEDKLQDKVPETIRDLRLAGIKVWMLTGDKLTTAKNIGLSCNLISHQMVLFEVCGDAGEDHNKLIREYEAYDFKENDSREFGILIDAVALAKLLCDIDETKKFLDIAHGASSVICCRVSPLQKSEVVTAMKEYDSKAVTLAIGDGGNDVSMIMMAHIGKNAL